MPSGLRYVSSEQSLYPILTELPMSKIVVLAYLVLFALASGVAMYVYSTGMAAVHGLQLAGF